MFGNPVEIFSIVAAIILIGFAGDQFFRRTGVPSFLFLILAGIIIGPILGIFSPTMLLPALGTISILTLTMVLFSGGIYINIRALLRNGGRIFTQVILYVILSMIIIAFFAHSVLGWDWTQALIFGSIVGGETTAAVMVPLARRLPLVEDVRVFLTVESALNSILTVIFFITFVGLYQSGGVSLSNAVSSIASNLSIGIVIGLALSLIWIYLLNAIKKYKYTYVLTLGLLFLTYSVSSSLGGSGLLAVLIFGIVLGNHGFIGEIIHKVFKMSTLEKRLAEFQEEISFLLETFFFVFLGLIFSIALSSLLFGLIIGSAIVIILLASRAFATTISTFRSRLAYNKKTIFLLCAQGLTPATLAILALSYNIPLANTFVELVTYIIIITNIVTTVGSYLAFNSNKPK
ncbi:cation:proton antiporter, partial [Candidatus Parvarchaeota archaeon]|nr:cation:proton antiporter [Candidatus Parvarchaeota archaeon]